VRGPRPVGEEVGAAREARLGVPPATEPRRGPGKTVRAVLLALVLAGVAGPVRAEPASPPGIGFAGKRPPAGAKAPRWGDGKTDGTQPIEEPARGSPYNYTQMAYGSVIMLAMLAFTIWLIRRHTRR
jgi:uncharacterized membrane protein